MLCCLCNYHRSSREDLYYTNLVNTQVLYVPRWQALERESWTYMCEAGQLNAETSFSCLLFFLFGSFVICILSSKLCSFLSDRLVVNYVKHSCLICSTFPVMHVHKPLLSFVSFLLQDATSPFELAVSRHIPRFHTGY